jgi:SAM-dependent methyltransferase
MSEFEPTIRRELRRGDKMMSNEAASAGLVSRTIPAWAIGLLATPGDKQRLRPCEDGIATMSGELIDVEDGIVNLSGRSKEDLQRHSEAFFAGDPAAVEFLKPQQQRFRQLLRRFARRLSPDATVADIAAADAEFASYYPTRRVLAMDLSIARLRRGIELGRVDFAVLADIRQPPLVDGSLDAIVSTNTLHQLPDEAVPEIVAGLVRCLKPDGRLAVTLKLATLPALIDRIGEDRFVEHVCIGGPVSQWWERVVYARSKTLIRRLGLRTARASKPLMDFISSSVTLGDRLVKPSPSAQLDLHWLVIQAS